MDKPIDGTEECGFLIILVVIAVKELEIILDLMKIALLVAIQILLEQDL
jgi:hypothetical protein